MFQAPRTIRSGARLTLQQGKKTKSSLAFAAVLQKQDWKNEISEPLSTARLLFATLAPET